MKPPIKDETYPPLDVSFIGLEHLPYCFPTDGCQFRMLFVQAKWIGPRRPNQTNLVWGDGKTTDREIVSATSRPKDSLGTGISRQNSCNADLDTLPYFAESRIGAGRRRFLGLPYKA